MEETPKDTNGETPISSSSKRLTIEECRNPHRIPSEDAIEKHLGENSVPRLLPPGQGSEKQGLVKTNESLAGSSKLREPNLSQPATEAQWREFDRFEQYLQKAFQTAIEKQQKALK